MTSNTRWISYYDIDEHPESSILLAFLRGQELEVRSRVIQHIDIEKCPVCLKKLNELKQVSTTLDVLGDIRSYQHYPELSAADTYARVQNAVNHRIPSKNATTGSYYRQRPRKSAVRLISVPAAFGLAILLTMSMLVFANLSGRSFNPFSLVGGTSPGQNVLTVVVPPQSTPTRETNLTATAIVTPTGTSEATEPQIKVCSTPANIAQLRLVICGLNFENAHKAILVVYVPGKRPLWLRNIPVDEHGKLQVGWNIADCGNVPSFIGGYEVTSSKPIMVELQITSFGSCQVPTITPVVGPFRGFTNFGK